MAEHEALGEALLIRARNAIAAQFDIPPQSEPDHPRLHEPGATFVTLTQHGELRGCIGSIEAWRALDTDIRANACAAAFRDPRFAPLRRAELDLTRVEVSLLTEPIPIEFADEADALRQIRPGIDGLVLQYGGRRGTFLPQVWESLPEPKDFLAHLKEKAGLPPNFWDDDVRLLRYEVRKWKEPTIR